MKIGEKWYFIDNTYCECKAEVTKIINDEAYISIYRKNNDAEYPWKEVGDFKIRAIFSHVAAKKLIYSKWLYRK